MARQTHTTTDRHETAHNRAETRPVQGTTPRGINGVCSQKTVLGTPNRTNTEGFLGRTRIGRAECSGDTPHFQTVENCSPASGIMVKKIQNCIPQCTNAVPDVHWTIPQCRNAVPDVRRTIPQCRNAVPDVHRTISQCRNAVPDVHQTIPLFTTPLKAFYTPCSPSFIQTTH